MTTSKRNSPKPSQTPAADQPKLARIHDLTGFVAVCIPQELIQILGEEEYDRHIKEIETYELTWIIRVPNDVVYLRSKLVTFPLGGGVKVEPLDPQAGTAKAKEKEKGKSAVAPTSKSSSTTPAKSARKPRGQA